MASRLHAALAGIAAVLVVVLLPAAARAGVGSEVTATAVSVSATCSGSPGATFTITGPEGNTFTVSTLNSDTAGFTTAGRARGTYRFTAICSNGTNAGSGSFVIAPVGGPEGGDGGDGGNALDSIGFITAGLLLLGAASCGAILLRRQAVRRR